MPILAREPDLFPPNLLAAASPAVVQGAASNVVNAPLSTARQWWLLYTLSRQEKQLMRRLRGLEIPYYCPLVPHRLRSPAGRVRTSYLPLFSNYVFLFGSDGERQLALGTRCVARAVSAAHDAQLPADLCQLQRLIAVGAPLAPEARLEAGARVRVRSGAFRDFEGIVIRREGQQRLLVAVNFLQQGASVLLDDCQLQSLDG